MNTKPVFRQFPPNKTRTIKTEISRETVFDGEAIELEKGRYFLDITYNRDDGDTYELVRQEVREEPNPEYATQLAIYEHAKVTQEAFLKGWEEREAALVLKKNQKTEQEERETLARLKAKYES